MGKVIFENGVRIANFNLNNKENIGSPNDSNNVKDSILYSISKEYFKDEKLTAVYKSTSLSSDDFAIYRKAPTDSYKTYLGLVSNVKNGIVDYGVASNKTYQYIIQPNPQDGSNISIETENIKIHWNCWSLVSLNYDLDKDIYIPDDTIFLFKNNLAVGSISDNMNFVKYNTLDRYGRVSQSHQNYESGSVSCLFGDFQFVEENGDKQYKYYEDSEKMYAWKECVYDQKAKLLKAPNGDMWVVSISDQTSRDVQYSSSSYPTTISFNWQEIMDKDKITIIKW